MPPNEPINISFQRALDERALIWQPKVEVNSLDLVKNYVVRGYGIGLYPDIPAAPLDKGLRKVPLTGFPPLIVGLMSLGSLKPIAAEFADETIRRARELAAKPKSKKPKTKGSKA